MGVASKKPKFGVNANGHYVGPLKLRHRRKGKPSLALRCLQDGTLDIDLATGEVWSTAKGTRTKLKTRIDEDGYHKFTLCRDTDGREKRKTDGSGRRRLKMEVFVHRLCMMKKLAVARGEFRWREHLEDLPGDREVHHRFGKDRNDATALMLEYSGLNGSRSPALSEEHAELF